jgi:hypothetical protein
MNPSKTPWFLTVLLGIWIVVIQGTGRGKQRMSLDAEPDLVGVLVQPLVLG